MVNEIDGIPISLGFPRPLLVLNIFLRDLTAPS